jgi:Divergent InlB B-repeat domain
VKRFATIFILAFLIAPTFATAASNIQANALAAWGWDDLNKIVPDSYWKGMLDDIKADGYSGIALDIRVSADDNGNITDLTPSVKVYDYVKYAKSIGLNPEIKITWTDKNNVSLWDSAGVGIIPSSFNMNVFINGAGEYIMKTANLANQSGVTGIYIGSENDVLFTTQYKSQWATVISNLRSVFHGKILYHARYFAIAGWWDARQVDIWDLVDQISLSFYPHLASGVITDVKAIEALYFANNPTLQAGYSYPTTKKCVWDTPTTSIVNDLKALSAQYGKTINFGEVVFADVSQNLCGWVNESDLAAANAPVDYDAQIRAYSALFNVLNNSLGGTVTAMNIGGYSPWNIFRTDSYAAWKPYSKFYKTPTEAAIKPYLAQWNPTEFPVYPGPTANLSVTTSASYSWLPVGVVTSNIVGIECGGRCSYDFTKGSTVTLTATPPTGSKLVKWGGACGGNKPTCKVRLTKDRAVTALFK